MDITIKALTKQHQRAAFVCGEESLELYIRRFARQNMQQRISKVFVASPITEPEIIAGYYTLSAGSLDAPSMPAVQRKKLPRYPIPIAMLGRLAIASVYQGQGLGQILVADALERVVQASQVLAVYAVVVDALNPSVAMFYQKLGFIPLPSQPLKLFLPLDSITSWTENASY